MAKEGTSLEQIMSDLKKRIYHPVYFFNGEEPYYIDKITEYMMDTVLTEAEKALT
jgi:DNA polymerase-3 subunit delta